MSDMMSRERVEEITLSILAGVFSNSDVELLRAHDAALRTELAQAQATTKHMASEAERLAGDLYIALTQLKDHQARVREVERINFDYALNKPVTEQQIADLQAQAAAMTKERDALKARWTTETPTVEGWYWEWNFGYLRVIHVYKWTYLGKENDPPHRAGWAAKTLWVTPEHTRDHPVPVDQAFDKDTKFAGPLPEPEEGA